MIMGDNRTTIALKAELLQRLEAISLQQAIFPDPETAIDKIVLALEDINPTPQPLNSNHLWGEWELIYASQGTVVTRQLVTIPDWMGININRVWQNLTIDDENQINTCNCALISLPVWGEWKVQADGKWAGGKDEKTAMVSFNAFSLQATQPFALPELKIPVLEFFRNEAVWITSYLDEEIRIGRGATGNLFVFRRK
jgi:hypothetical protein